MSKKIILIVGPSGVGKDTLLKNIKNKIKANFVKRYITRVPDENESNYFLQEEAFKILEKNNFFISTWNAHNNFYGIAKNSILEGLNIISISRAKIKDFEKQYQKVYTINITLNKNDLKQRLEKRARESIEEIEKRLSRSYEKIEARNLIEFENNKNLTESVEEFLKLLGQINED
ncbi:hypothetical protein CRU99_11775 [Malaciobacter mytili]|uniref:AAA family ATPase n=1 Tax=Malaciobacter mytili TaxID=603050 RepID=UPI00100BC76C|nr:AAA family ATPase [Malaciobacter mytili]RXI37569.1 hypothetical protein CRU99_11775 [Malaciobacter mytili]